MAFLLRRRNELSKAMNMGRSILQVNSTSKLAPSCTLSTFNAIQSRTTLVAYNRNIHPLLSTQTPTQQQQPLYKQCAVNLIANRGVVTVSRLGKRKSVKSVRRRFFRVKGGFLKRWRTGKVHKMRKKSSWRRFRLRGSVLVKNKTQLKTLNKMLLK